MSTRDPHIQCSDSTRKEASDIKQLASVRQIVPLPMNTRSGIVQGSIVSFIGLSDHREHVAILFEPLDQESVPLVRIHSECLTGDALGSARCDCGPQLTEAIDRLSAEHGILLYLRQEGRGIGLYNKLDAYALQDTGLDTFAANERLGFPADAREYKVAGEMLRAIGIDAVRLLSNNPDKRQQLEDSGVDVLEAVGTGVHVGNANRNYLSAKAKVRGHAIDLKASSK